MCVVLHASAYSLTVVFGDPNVLYHERKIRLTMFCLDKALIDRVNWPFFLMTGFQSYQMRCFKSQNEAVLALT